MSRERLGTVFGFAERLDSLIQQNGYTYNFVAERVGRERKSVYGWKNGTTIPDGVIIVRLCTLLHATPNYLLLGKE